MTNNWVYLKLILKLKQYKNVNTANVKYYGKTVHLHVHVEVISSWLGGK